MSDGIGYFKRPEMDNLKPLKEDNINPYEYKLGPLEKKVFDFAYGMFAADDVGFEIDPTKTFDENFKECGKAINFNQGHKDRYPKTHRLRGLVQVVALPYFLIRGLIVKTDLEKEKKLEKIVSSENLGTCPRKGLIEAKANLDTQDGNGKTALMRTLKNPSDAGKALKGLLEAGADVSVKDNRGYTALALAVEYDNKGAIDLLINAPDKEGNTPLMLAVQNKNTDLVSALLDLGADVSIQDKKGLTALRQGIRLKNSEAIDLLINAPNKEGETLLMLAVNDRDADMASALVKIGAKYDMSDSKLLSRKLKDSKGNETSLLSILTQKAKKNVIDSDQK
jgi:hypothetical protein